MPAPRSPMIMLVAAAVIGCTPDSPQAPLAPDPVPAFAVDAAGPSATGHGNVTQAPGVLRTFSFTARQLRDGRIEGEYENHNRLGGATNHGDIDCMVITGNSAVLSGPIRRHTNPLFEEGFVTVFRVEDNGEGANDPPDQVSVLQIHPPPAPGQPEVNCRSGTLPAFAMRPIEGGNVQVRP